MKKSLAAALLAVTNMAPAVAVAQDAAVVAATPSVGAKVFDTDGNEVGAVESVQNGVITVNTGSVRAGLPASAFAMREKGATIAMTKAQVEAAVNGAKADTAAARDAAIVADAPVKSSDGVVLGTISKIAGDDVTVQLSTGAPILLKKSAIGLVNGELTLGMTAAAVAEQTKAGAAATTAETGAETGTPPGSQ